MSSQPDLWHSVPLGLLFVSYFLEIVSDTFVPLLIDCTVLLFWMEDAVDWAAIPHVSRSC